MILHHLSSLLPSLLVNSSTQLHIIFAVTVNQLNHPSVSPAVFWPLTSIALALGILNSWMLLSKRERGTVPTNTGSPATSAQIRQGPIVLTSPVSGIRRTLDDHGQLIKDLYHKYNQLNKMSSSESPVRHSQVNRASSHPDQQIEVQRKGEPAVNPNPGSLNDTGDIKTDSTLSFDLAARVDLQKSLTAQEPAYSKPEVSKASMIARAIEVGDFSTIRDIAESELNITRESDDALTRRLPGHKTQLEDVSGGGSYHRLSEGSQTLLFPTSQSLRLFSKNQPVLGTFDYELQPASRPMIKKPAVIIRLTGGNWEVHEMGVIVIPE